MSDPKRPVSAGVESTDQHALPPLDQLAFRKVMGHFASGVTVITSRVDGANYGMTANAFTSLSLEPPLVVVCLNAASRTRAAITECGRFAVNILRDDQGNLAERFASNAPDRFTGLELAYGELGQPLLAGALAHVECRVVEEVPGGTHSIVIGEAQRASAREGLPLGYFRGAFGYFLSGGDAAVYVELRGRLRAGELPEGAALDVEHLAELLGSEPAMLHGALSRLARERLVLREHDGTFRVPGVDARAIEEVVGARRILEAGAAEATVGIVAGRELDAWEELAHLPCAFEPAARGSTTRPSCDFHEQLIRFARNQRLLDDYLELSLEHVPLVGPPVASPNAALVRDHLAIVDGYRSGDLEAVTAAIARHARRLREAWLAAATLEELRA